MELFILDIPDGENKDFQIALVDDPAIESDWVAFNKQTPNFTFKNDGDKFTIVSKNFKVQSEEKRIISGYAMIADLEIPRFDEVRGTYNVVFKKDNIEKIWLNFQRQNLNTNTNIMHQTGEFAPGVFVCESVFLDKERGARAHEGFDQEADGSWFISMKVENDEIWEKVLDGSFKGFSIEGRFRERNANEFSKVTLNDILKINKMSKPKLIDKVLDFFSANPEERIAFQRREVIKEILKLDDKFEKMEFLTEVLVDDTEVIIEPAVEVGAAIVINDAEGNPIPTPPGDYELKDGRVLVVAEAGVISEVKEAAAGEEEEEMGDENPEQQKVKKIIERIESEKIFERLEQLEKDNKFLKEENEALKKDQVDHKKDVSNIVEENKTEFESLKTFSKEVFEELSQEPVKTPVKPVYNPLKKEERKNHLLNTKQD